MTGKIRGLYGVTPDEADTTRLLTLTRAACEGGMRILQLRNKVASPELYEAQARALRKLTREYGCVLIINDNAPLAAKVDADGAHLGAEDGSIREARALLGPRKLLGATCYGSLENARIALADGADHVAFGGFFRSTVKPGNPQRPLSLLTEAKREFKVPVVAIGGITQATTSQLIAAGADAVAVITALFGAPDVTKAAKEFCALFGD
ncbi:MAG: thiamine phosphate synthase [Betaproteobacteria bacterium]|nr:thiamine phosphate synthase [Betaproteobacteria bacterium]